MLGRMLCCTLLVPRLAGCIEAWQQWLDYRLISRGHVSAAQARVWGAAAMAGCDTALLAAASASPSYLRLVAAAATPGYARLRTWGWNALEILVADAEALAGELAGSPFEVVIAPRPIPYDPRIRAMQVVGPAGELLYLTQLPAAGTPLGLAAARARVERAFIGILGGPALDPMLQFYQSRFGNPIVPRRPTVVRIVNETYGLPPDQKLGLGVVKLAPGDLLELDEYPASAVARPRREGELPPGIAMLSFEIDEAAWPDGPCRSAPAPLGEAPYCGARVAVMEGAAGEWIELIGRAARQ